MKVMASFFIFFQAQYNKYSVVMTIQNSKTSVVNKDCQV